MDLVCSSFDSLWKSFGVWDYAFGLRVTARKGPAVVNIHKLITGILQVASVELVGGIELCFSEASVIHVP